MNSSLSLAAKSLKARLEVACTSSVGSSTAEAEWMPLINFYEGKFPADYVELMASFPFDYITLAYRGLNELGKHPEYIDVHFRFRSSCSALGTGFMEGLDDVMKQMNLVVIGEGDDGDFWVARVDRGIESSIYYVEATAWNGGLLHPDNGLSFAAPSLAHLIAGFALTNYNFGFNHRNAKTEAFLELSLFFPYSASDKIYNLSDPQ